MDISKIKVTNIKTRKELRDWFVKNSLKFKEIWLPVKIGKPNDINLFYIDTIEEALCFGWIDSINLKHPKYGHIHRLTPRRKKNSHWSELNKQRCRRLIKLKLMTKFGYKTLPNLNQEVKINNDLKKIFKHNPQLFKNFFHFPKLYQKIRIDAIQRYKTSNKFLYHRAIKNFIKQTKNNKMYGQWNDYGRLK